METKDVIKNRRIEIGLTMKQVADAVGVSEGTISRWESGDIINMRRDKIALLADTLRITPARIMGWDETPKTPARRIPVYGRVAAGIPIEAIENILDWEEIPSEWNGEYGCLTINGDSMSPRILDGDRVIVRKQSDAESGDIVIAIINGNDGVCKKLIKHDSGITLQSLNPAYEPMYFSRESQESTPVTIWGKVVELRGRM